MLRSTFLFIFFFPTFLWAGELRLLLVEQEGCVWCARWDAEIAESYPKTAEGMAAPLSRINLRRKTPPGLVLKREVLFTPTFILIENGAELTRLEGYPGPDFFWPLLAQMIDQASATATPATMPLAGALPPGPEGPLTGLSSTWVAPSQDQNP